jgi:hypothetical protein
VSYADTLFLLDATGSMQPWIDKAVAKIHAIADDAMKVFGDKKAVLRFAAVCYRDIGDED